MERQGQTGKVTRCDCSRASPERQGTLFHKGTCISSLASHLPSWHIVWGHLSLTTCNKMTHHCPLDLRPFGQGVPHSASVC